MRIKKEKRNLQREKKEHSAKLQDGFNLIKEHL